MSADLRDISLDLSGWTLYKTVEPFTMLGVPMTKLKQRCYQSECDGKVISAGVFEYDGKRTHIAWGIKSDPHCSFHALALQDGTWGAAVAGCPEYQLLRSDGIVVGFSVDSSQFAAETDESQ